MAPYDTVVLWGGEGFWGVVNGGGEGGLRTPVASVTNGTNGTCD